MEKKNLLKLVESLRRTEHLSVSDEHYSCTFCKHGSNYGIQLSMDGVK